MQVGTTFGVVEGWCEDGLVMFAGIPFAAPPVGDLRFAPPQPPRAWDGVLSATLYRSDAPQATQTSFDEDCLYLNVWSPAVPGNRPVLVYVYGGGFEGGSASPPLCPAGSLARDLDVVVVAATYRVGALGFLHLADRGPGWENSSNLGLRDQLAALEWVRDNVANFGGDPTRVTVAGSSAGAFSVGAMLGLSEAKGLFGQAILASGSTGRLYPVATAQSIAADLMRVNGVNTPQELRDLPVADLVRTQSEVIESDIGRRNLPGGRAYGVVHDGRLIVEAPQAAVRAGRAADVTLLIGTNADEIDFWKAGASDGFTAGDESDLLAEMSAAGEPDPASRLAELRAALVSRGRPTAPADLRSAYLTDAIYVGPANELADEHVRAGGTAYRYVFADQPFGPALGAGHAIDALYFFDALAAFDVDNEHTRGVRVQILACWRSFVHGKGPGWATHRVGDRDFTNFGG